MLVLTLGIYAKHKRSGKDLCWGKFASSTPLNPPRKHSADLLIRGLHSKSSELSLAHIYFLFGYRSVVCLFQVAHQSCFYAPLVEDSVT